LSGLGAQVEVIDYKPEYIYRLIDFMAVDSPKWQDALWKRWLFRARMFPVHLSHVLKYCRYKRFNRKRLNLTRRRFTTEQELRQLSGFDAFICGSDQIWSSVKNKCVEDGAFYLSFAGNATKISYAASFGAAEMSAEGEACVRRYLPSFHAVSVREASGVELLKACGIAACQVIDPVFLLNREHWEEMARKPKHLPERYVLSYGYDSSVDLSALAADFGDLPVVSLGSKMYGGYGPEEFLYMIRNADLVVTSSFHAVAFSLMFETPFVAVQTGNAALFERLQSILELTGLTERVWHPGEDISSVVDFQKAREVLARERDNSKAFLREALYGRENN
jgi:polysaccharide pyruvyl transferase WcaK-like protein